MFFCGGTSPPTPPELRKGRSATPHGPFAIHEVVEAWCVILAWPWGGVGGGIFVFGFLPSHAPLSTFHSTLRGGRGVCAQGRRPEHIDAQGETSPTQKKQKVDAQKYLGRTQPTPKITSTTNKRWSNDESTRFMTNPFVKKTHVTDRPTRGEAFLKHRKSRAIKNLHINQRLTHYNRVSRTTNRDIWIRGGRPMPHAPSHKK